MEAATAGQLLLEREREVEAVSAALEMAAGGRGSVLLIEGEGGIGKSALLDRAADTAARKRLRVVRAGGRSLESDYAFGVVHQLLGRVLAEAAPDERQSLLEGAAAGAAALLEGGGPPGKAFPSINAATWMIANAAERGPLAIVVDDCHWADAPSLRLLAYLTQRVADMPVAVILAARPAGPGPAAEVLPHIRAAAETTVLRPQGLSRAGVGWLVAELGFPAADPEFVGACAEVTGGNPFLLRELLYVLAREAVEATASTAARVREVGPRTVAQAVYLALGAAGRASASLARALAVAGPGTPVTLLARLARLDPAAAVDAAARLADAGLLDGDGQTVSFAHPILATAVYDDLRPFERAHAHAQTARLLHEAGAADPRLATQLAGAEVIGEPWALDALREAASAAIAGGDPGSAVRYLSRALDEPGATGSAELLLELAAARRLAGDEDAGATFERALAVAGDDETAARVLLEQGRHLLAGGDYPAAAAVLKEGLGRCPAGDSELTTDLRSTWAGAAMWDPGQGAEAVGETVAILGAIEQPNGPAERMALASAATAELIKGDSHERALALAQAAWGDGHALREQGPEDPSLFAVTATLTAADRFDQSSHMWDALGAEARRRGLLSAAATASYGRGNVDFLRGHLDDALADIEFALDWQRKGWGLYACGAYWTLARIHLERGAADLAARALTVSDERENELARGVDYTALVCARASVAADRGRFAEALAQAERARELGGALGWEVNVFSWRHPAVRALVGLGETERAAQIAAEAVAHARRWGAPSYVAEALRTRARAEPARELELLEEAVTLHEEGERRLERAHATVELGLALGRAGQTPGAREILRRGLDLADACAATALAVRARDGLVATGARPRRARSSGRGALTPAELRVARLAADGHTNRQIAEALFVTMKAVKWHLGNVYRKLEISSRDQLAEALGH